MKLGLRLPKHHYITITCKTRLQKNDTPIIDHINKIILSGVFFAVLRNQKLTLKVPNKNCSRQHFTFLLLSFEQNKAWFFMWILCLAEDSLETSSLIFSEKQWKKYLWLSSAAVVIGALRVNRNTKGWKAYVSLFNEKKREISSQQSCRDAT